MALHRQLLLFGCVGLCATLMHLLTVSELVPLGMDPLVANIGGFIIAFGVSFTGHTMLTFPSSGQRLLAKARRFFIVACCGFAANEFLYWILLENTALDFRVALFFVLLIVATATFIVSKIWVFGDA